MTRATDPHSIAGLLARATQQLSGSSARLDAEVLLAHALDQPRSYLFTWPERAPEATRRARFETLLERRRQGEPVAYLTGLREFWSLPLAVTTATLIPRPETESLVAQVLDTIPAAASLQIADLGTGSGAIVLALASERPGCHFVATDRSADALAVARRNADTLGLRNIEFVCGNWLEPLAGQRFHRIVSNPPYLAAADPHLTSGDVRFEPRSALSAGADGLAALRVIIRDAGNHLHDGGMLFLEHGYDQGPAVCALLGKAGFQAVTASRDPAGLDRVAQGSWQI